MDPQAIFIPSFEAAQADPRSTFCFPGVRFSLLTPRLVRVEISPDNQFEDRPTQAFWYRRQAQPAAQVRADAAGLQIETANFRLSYQANGAAPVAELLRFEVKDTGAVFHLDDLNPGQLPGTARTLDETNGPIQLHPGFISRAGWVQLDDTPSLVFNAAGWLEPRPALPGYRDLYILVSGTNYPDALHDYQLISGFPSLLPRAFLGNWWSRFWEYSQDSVQALVERFAQERIPLSVFIIDMDWHITNTGNACSGWTGFTWNRELFPDPPALLAWLHERRLLTSLNLHPAEGIHAHEERYPQAAQAMGRKPGGKKPIAFNIADPRFARVYFEQLLHPMEAEGVDFWWIDWQQGFLSSLPSLDPLWWLNHLHFFDLGRNPQKRPVVFSRWGGPGNQRYPIGFSGDTIISWKSLAYQPFFTAAAANMAYGWWSHDIGGHMRGMEDSELYTRWVQFGVLSPIFRLHCTKDAFIDRQPWAFDAEVLRLARQAMQFRHALVPYLYTMARRNEQTGQPLCAPLYYEWPREEAAYVVPNQYLFGNQLLAAPVTAPADPDLRQARCGLWFPPGEWFDFFSGEAVKGGRWTIQYFAQSEIPLYARAGAIVPLQADTAANGCPNPETLDVVVFPGRDGRFVLYEDDGVSQVQRTKGGCETIFYSQWDEQSITLHIDPPCGDLSVLPEKRAYRLVFRGVTQPEGCEIKFDGVPQSAALDYDPQTRTAMTGRFETGHARFEARIFTTKGPLQAAAPTTAEKALRLLRHARMETVTKWKISTLLDRLEKDITLLNDFQLELTASHLRALTETLTGAGAVEIHQPDGSPQLVLLNPANLAGFKCSLKNPIKIHPGGSLVSDKNLPAAVNYFGLLRQKFYPASGKPE